MRAEEVIQEVAKLCNSFHAKEVILYGSRAKGTARERSDIDIAVSGIEDFEALIEKVEDLPTLYSVDLVNMDTCKKQDREISRIHSCLVVQVPNLALHSICHGKL